MATLPFIWAWLLALAVLLYVLLDGFDLGVGILFAWFGKDHRDAMVNSIAPVWDGNETWLVFGGSCLLGAFPLAYAVLLPAFYAPLLAMVLALVFRGVAFEFRGRRGPRTRSVWDFGFAVGSIVAAFSQGVMLGTFVQGIEVVERHYAGGWFDWLTPFSMLTGLAVVAGYALLGTGWLLLKLPTSLQGRCRALIAPLTVVVLLALGAVSVWTPLIDPAYAQRWFGWPNVLYAAPVPIIVVTLASMLLRTSRAGRDLAPFLCAEGVFVVSFTGFGVSVYPYIVPRAITIDAAAAPDDSLRFLLVGAAILIPVILVYTTHAYWVFRGKTTVGSGYH